MRVIKQINSFSKEIKWLFVIYIVLVANFICVKDNPIALFSAFFGITYTMLAGKGMPICYIFGVMGSGLYSYLSYSNAIWGNLILYMGYYIPMQILGFFQWQKNLKNNSSEIVKTRLSTKEFVTLLILCVAVSIAGIYFLNAFGDKSPVIDGITTVLSVAGMYLTVKRCIEQWQCWIIVNGLATLMWLRIAMSGEKVYSTVIMWAVYFILAIYFYYVWSKEINLKRNS